MMSSPKNYDQFQLGEQEFSTVPGLITVNPTSDIERRIAPGYRQIGVNVDNILSHQEIIRTNPNYPTLTPVEYGLPDGKPEDAFMYTLTHEMGHILHESVPALADRLSAQRGTDKTTNEGSLARILSQVLSQNSAEEGATLSRYDAVTLANEIQREAVKISKKRRGTQWLYADTKHASGIRSGAANRTFEYLNMPQELLADVGATMLEDPASIRNTEIYSLLKNLFGKGVYKDVIKFGAFGGLTLPQILQMSEQNETQG